MKVKDLKRLTGLNHPNYGDVVVSSVNTHYINGVLVDMELVVRKVYTTERISIMVKDVNLDIDKLGFTIIYFPL